MSASSSTVESTQYDPTAVLTGVAEASQSETIPSDSEIMRRVRLIKRSWSTDERKRRRDEADRRFADLMTALTEAAHSAA